MPLAATDASARTRGLNLCRSRALDWSDSALQQAHDHLRAARSADDQETAAQAAEHLAEVHTARAEFRSAAHLRRHAAELVPTNDRALVTKQAVARYAVYTEQADMRPWIDTDEVLKRARRNGKEGWREDDLVLLLWEAERSRCTRVLNAAASAARACGERGIAYGLAAKSFDLDPTMQSNPAAFVVLASLLNDETGGRDEIVLARDILTELERIDPDNEFMHRTAVVTWRALGNREEAQRHAVAAVRKERALERKRRRARRSA